MSPTDRTFYVTGGTLRHDAPCYVERRADRYLYDGLKGGEFCYVLTARQMGKSSLMVRTAARLRQEGVSVVMLDLTAIGQNLSAEQWYDGLLRSLAPQVGLEQELEAFWLANRRLSPLQRWMAALQQVVLPNLSIVSRQLSVAETAPDSRQGDGTSTTDHGPRTTDDLVIFVDEIDIVRSLPFSTDEFFAAIRECYNRRTEDRFIDGWISVTQAPYHPDFVAPPAPDNPLLQQNDPGPFRNGWRSQLMCQAQLELLKTSVALHAFHLHDGSYPSDLAALVPGYLKSLPSDPFAPANQLHYRPLGEKFLLYSVGPDAKDDAGAAQATALSHWKGDILLLKTPQRATARNVPSAK